MRQEKHRNDPAQNARDAVNALWQVMQSMRDPLHGVELFLHDGLGAAAKAPVDWKALSNSEKLRLRKHYHRVLGDDDAVKPDQPEALVKRIREYLRRLPDGLWRGDEGYSAEKIARCVGLIQRTEVVRHLLECSFRSGGIFACTPEGSPAAILVAKHVDDFPNARDGWGGAPCAGTIRRWENRQLAAALAEPVERREKRGRMLMHDLRALEKQLWQIEELGQAALAQMMMDYDGHAPFDADIRRYLASAVPQAWARTQQQYHHIGFFTPQHHEAWWAQWRGAYDAYLAACQPAMQELRIPRVAALDSEQMQAYSNLAQAQFRYVVYGVIQKMSTAKQVCLETEEVRRHHFDGHVFANTHYRYHNLRAQQQEALKAMTSACHELGMPTGRHVEKAMADELDAQMAGFIQFLAQGEYKTRFAGHGLHPDNAARSLR